MVKFRQKLDDPSCELSKLDDVGGQDSRPPSWSRFMVSILRWSSFGRNLTIWGCRVSAPPVGQDLGFCSLGNVTPSPRRVLAQMTFERTHASAVATHSQLHIHIKAAQQLHPRRHFCRLRFARHHGGQLGGQGRDR